MARPARHAPKARPPRLEVGAMVDGYRIRHIVCDRPGLHTLAEGAKRGETDVMLDAIARPLSEDRDMRRRLARLARVRGQIRHPHVLHLMRTVDGGQRLHLRRPPAGTMTLAERLAAGSLSREHALRILGQVAGALETARVRGLAHRQLSPRAILVTPADPPDALLTDFGIGTPAARACELAGAVEESAYRSPEELRGGHPDARSNVYALCCILVESLTGRPPYDCERPLLTIQAHLTEEPPRPSERAPDLPPKLDALVAGALAKDPGARPHSAAVLMRAVGQALGIKFPIPIVAPHPTHARAPARAHERVEPSRTRVAPATPPAAAAAAAAAAAPPPAPAPPSPPAPAPPRPVRRAPRTSRTPRTPRIPRIPRIRGFRAPAYAAWVALAVLASTVSGFAAAGASSSRPDDDGPAVARSLPSPPQHVAAPSTDRVIDRLDRRRRAARQRLHAAHSRSDQARAAAALADAYRTAREELSPAVGPRKSLGEQLRVVEQAYERLRDAARSGRPGAWGAARETARDAETDLELMLRSQPWT